MTKLPVSLVIISLNEEAHIERCIDSCPWASEVVLLDSGSSDKTVQLAKSKGAKIFVEPFRGYREQKKRATELAQNDWIFSLDADEALSPELGDEIKNIFKQNNLQADGFQMPRKSFYLNRWIMHGGWFPDKQLRLFNRKSARWVGGHVHEHVAASSIKQLKYPILHWVFKDISDQIETNNRYSGYGALDLFEKGKKFSFIKLTTKPISKFLETYVVKRGFLDGLPGFIIAVSAAYSVFLKFAKLWEIEKTKATSQIK